MYVRKLEDCSVLITMGNVPGGSVLAVTLEKQNLKAFLHFVSCKQIRAAANLLASVYSISPGNSLVFVDIFVNSAVGKQMISEFNSSSALPASQQMLESPRKPHLQSVSLTHDGGIQITTKNGGLDMKQDLLNRILSAYVHNGEQAMTDELVNGMRGLNRDFATKCVRAFLESEVGRGLVRNHNPKDTQTGGQKPRTGRHLDFTTWTVILFAAASMGVGSLSHLSERDDRIVRTREMVARFCGKAEQGATRPAVNTRRLFY